MKAMNGVIQARLAPRDDAERDKAVAPGTTCPGAAHR